VDPFGKILAMAEPFAEAWLSVEVPVATSLTLYTRYGDYLGRFFTGAAFIMLILGAILYIMNMIKRRLQAS
jgi:apolipoprotein N-acyltransferase